MDEEEPRRAQGDLEGPAAGASSPAAAPLPPIPADSTVSPPGDIPALPDVGLFGPSRRVPPVTESRGSPVRLPGRSSGRASGRAEAGRLPLVTEEDLRTHLEGRAEALRTGDLPRAQLALDLLEEARRALAVRNVVIASTLLVHEAKNALDEGQPARAVRLAEAAGRLSPELPAAHWMRIQAYLRHEASGAGRVIAGARDFVLAWVVGFRNQVHLSVQLVLVTLAAFLGTAGLFAFVQLMKYVTFSAHDLASFGPSFVGTGEVLILLVAVVSLPLVVLVSLPISITVALVVLMAYQSKSERWVSIVLIGALAIAPWLLRLAAPLATLDGSPADLLASAVGEALVSDVEDRLEWEMNRNRDFVSAVVLAHRLRKRGELEGAETAYRNALDVRPGESDAQNNLGVVQYLRGRRDAARTAFKAAQRGGQAEPVLNLAVMTAEDGRFDEANRLLERAKGLDAALVERYQALDPSLTAGQKLAEVPLSDGLLWRALFTHAATERAAIARELGRPTLGLTTGWGLTGTLLVLALVGLALSRFQGRVSAGCSKCGLPARPDPNRQLCDQCRSVFLSGMTVDPELRRTKERKVRRYQRWRRWSVRFMALMAGAGDVFAGRVLAGIVMLFVFSFAVCVAWVPGVYGVYAWRVFTDDSLSQAQGVLGIGIAGLMSLWSLGRTLAR